MFVFSPLIEYPDVIKLIVYSSESAVITGHFFHNSFDIFTVP